MSLTYTALRGPTRLLLRTFTDLRVEGVEHLPDDGPFLLVPNHQSLADPFLVQAYCRRPVHSMTKSTQFAPAVFRWFIPRLCGFPVRRYRVDPQAVRVLLRLLEEGEGVCIYPEGERTWDGTMQPFRRGALRVLLRAGVPIVPVGISGTYDLWPRWASRPRPGFGPRVKVGLRYGEPLCYGEIRDRSTRERLLPELERRLRTALQELSRPGG
ncbi:MAG: lysophospholipid acyltransferase family protein [Gemmatimonadota bacterium]